MGRRGWYKTNRGAWEMFNEEETVNNKTILRRTKENCNVVCLYYIHDIKFLSQY